MRTKPLFYVFWGDVYLLQPCCFSTFAIGPGREEKLTTTAVLVILFCCVVIYCIQFFLFSAYLIFVCHIYVT